MTKQDLEKKLVEVRKNKEEAKAVFNMLHGQEQILIAMIEEENKNEKPKEEPKK